MFVFCFEFMHIFVFIVCVNVSYFVSVYVSMYMTVFSKTNQLARKTNFFFIALMLPFMSSKDAAVQI